MNNFYEFLKYASSRLEYINQLNRYIDKKAGAPPTRIGARGVGTGGAASIGAEVKNVARGAFGENSLLSLPGRESLKAPNYAPGKKVTDSGSIADGLPTSKPAAPEGGTPRPAAPEPNPAAPKPELPRPTSKPAAPEGGTPRPTESGAAPEGGTPRPAEESAAPEGGTPRPAAPEPNPTAASGEGTGTNPVATEGGQAQRNFMRYSGPAVLAGILGIYGGHRYGSAAAADEYATYHSATLNAALEEAKNIKKQKDDLATQLGHFANMNILERLLFLLFGDKYQEVLTKLIPKQ